MGASPGDADGPMARRRSRRRRQEHGLLDEALQRDWIFSAVIAAGCLVIGFIMLPLLQLSNPHFALLTTVVQPLATLLSAGFALIALAKLIRAQRAVRPSRREPTISAEEALDTEEPEPLAVASSEPLQADPGDDRPSAWSLDVLHCIEWKRFEDLCCAYYREKGVAAETTALGPDGGVDIRLFQDAAQPSKATALVQCKAHNKPIGVKPIRELRGVMAHENAEKAFFMAPMGFTDEARAFAAANRITLLDGKLFLAMIERLPESSRARLLALATAGDWTTPTCPSCGDRMIAREGKRGRFWGCRGHRCKGTLPMRGEAPLAG